MEQLNPVNHENCTCVIVTYNPDSSILDNLNAHLKLFSQIIIVDNNSKNVLFNQIESFCKNYNQIKIIKLYKNYGIAYGLNKGIEAVKSASQWICLFDQDSYPPRNLFSSYNFVLESVNFSNKTGIIGVGFSEKASKCLNFSYRKSLSIITSGSLVNKKVFNKIGFFNETFFIDSVDFEFNLRLSISGFDTYLIDQKILKHSLGNIKCKKFLFMNICSTNHNHLRRFYIARNHAALTLDYFKSFPLWIIKKNYFFLLSLIKLIIIEKDRKIKLNHTIRGLSEGCKFSKKFQ